MKKEKRESDFLHKPVFPGGVKAMRQLIRANLQYPEAARQEKITGTVNLRYAISYLGEVTEVKVISGLGFGCDEEAIRLVRLLRFEVPKNRKLKVLFHKTIQIHFRLAEKPATQAIPKAPDQAPEKRANTITYHYIPEKKEEAAATEKPETNGYTYTIKW